MASGREIKPAHGSDNGEELRILAKEEDKEKDNA